MKLSLTSLTLGATLLLALSACGPSSREGSAVPADPQATVGPVGTTASPDGGNADSASAGPGNAAASPQAINCPTHDCVQPGPVAPPVQPVPPVTPPAPPSLPGSGPNIQMRMVVDSVKARDNIEWTGVDEFYLIGDLLVSKANGARKSVPFLVPTFDIDEGQTHIVHQVVLSEVVGPGSDMLGQMVAFDEDFSKDWLGVRAAVLKYSDAAAAGAGLLGPKGAVVAGIIKGITSVVDPILSNIDHDDKLGTINVAAPLLSYTMAPRVYSRARLHQSGWYDSFDYDVNYHLEFSRTWAAQTF